MGLRIDQLDPYGVFDSEIMGADIIEISKNDGTLVSPNYPADGSRQLRLDKLAEMVAILTGLDGDDPAFVRRDGTLDLVADWDFGGAAGYKLKTSDFAAMVNKDSGYNTFSLRSDYAQINIWNTALWVYPDRVSFSTGGGKSVDLYSPAGSGSVSATFQDASGTVAYLEDLEDFINKDGSVDFEADQSMGGFSLTNIHFLSDSTQNAIDIPARWLLDANGNIIANFAQRTDGFGINTNLDKYVFLKGDLITDNRTAQFQDSSGTVAWLSDFGGASSTEVGYLSGATSNIQNQINNLYLSTGGAKTSARILMNTNVNISSPGATLDGETMAVDDRVVLNGQSTGSQNGVYVWNGAAVPMTRATDCSTGGTGLTGVLGMIINIEEGTYADQLWSLSNDAPITIDTTPLVFAKISGTTYTGSNGILLTGNNFTFDYAYFTGDVTFSSLGVTAIGASTVTNTMLFGGIAASKLIGTDIATVGTITSGIWNAGAVTSSSTISGLAFVNTGTAGAGYYEAIAQSANVSAPSGTGLRLFAGSTGNFSWVKKNGSDTYVRAFSSANTADRTYTWQDNSYTIAGIDIAQSFTALQTFANDIAFSSGKGIKDANGNYVLTLPLTVASPVNYWTISNSATGADVSFGVASGSGDSNVSTLFSTKGTGVHKFNAAIHLFNGTSYVEALKAATTTLNFGAGFAAISFSVTTTFAGISSSAGATLTAGNLLTGTSGNIYMNNGTSGGTGLGQRVIHMYNGTAPAPSITTDRHQYYSADIVAGNAAPHFLTEAGDLIKLYSVSGWGTPTGTLTRTTFDPGTVTLPQLAERLAALISDLKTGHQLLKA